MQVLTVPRDAVYDRVTETDLRSKSVNSVLILHWVCYSFIYLNCSAQCNSRNGTLISGNVHLLHCLLGWSDHSCVYSTHYLLCTAFNRRWEKITLRINLIHRNGRTKSDVAKWPIKVRKLLRNWNVIRRCTSTAWRFSEILRRCFLVVVKLCLPQGFCCRYTLLSTHLQDKHKTCMTDHIPFPMH